MATMDLASIPRELPQFGRHLSSLARRRYEVFHQQSEGKAGCGCGAGAGCCGCGGRCGHSTCINGTTQETCACSSQETKRRLEILAPTDARSPTLQANSYELMSIWQTPKEPTQQNPPTPDLCADLNRCRLEWSSLKEDSPEWIRKRSECMQIRSRIRIARIKCSVGPETNPLDKAKAEKLCQGAGELSKESARACDYSDSDVMHKYGCSWSLKCVCNAFPDTKTGKCMRACVACLRNTDNNYGEDGHNWCRDKCGFTDTDRDAFVTAAQTCVTCPGGLMTAYAVWPGIPWFSP